MPTPFRSYLWLQHGSVMEAQIGFGEPGIPKHPWQGPGRLGFPGSDPVSAHRPHSSPEAESGPGGADKASRREVKPAAQDWVPVGEGDPEAHLLPSCCLTDQPPAAGPGGPTEGGVLVAEGYSGD